MAATTSYLTFSVAESDYGAPLARVQEIIEYARPTRVPTTAACIRGVLNVRGKVVPVVDLAIKLGFAPRAPTRRSCVVLVEVEGYGAPTVIGVIADTVNDIVELGPGDLQPAPPFGTQVRLEFLRGIGSTAAGLVLLLEIDRVLSPEELAAAAAATGGAPP